jgi:hypothetical protein
LLKKDQIWRVGSTQCAESYEDLKIFGAPSAAKFLSTEDLGNTFGNLLEPLATFSLIFSKAEQKRVHQNTTG